MSERVGVRLDICGFEGVRCPPEGCCVIALDCGFHLINQRWGIVQICVDQFLDEFNIRRCDKVVEYLFLNYCVIHVFSLPIPRSALSY